MPPLFASCAERKNPGAESACPCGLHARKEAAQHLFLSRGLEVERKTSYTIHIAVSPKIHTK